MHRAIRIAAAALLLAASACAATGGGAAAPRRNADEISEAEIRNSTHQNAYELVQAVRSDWLRKRSSTESMRAAGVARGASDEVVAYLDGQRLGDATALRSISTQDIALMRHYSASSAQQRWGNGHTNGVIEVVTRSGVRN